MKKLTCIIAGMAISFNSFSQLSSNGLHFDGGTQQVATVSNYYNTIGTGNFTVEAWIRDEAVNPGFPTEEPILDNRENSPGPDYGFRFAINDGRPVFFAGSGGSGIGGADLRDGICHHVAMTRNSGTIYFYVDGQLNGSTSNNSSINSNAPVLCIGGKDNWMGGVWSFNGLIKEIRIWNSARSQSEIQNNMNTVLNGAANPNLVGYWRCNDVGSQVITDYSSQQNHATLGVSINVESSDPTPAAGCPTCTLPSGNISAGGPITFCSGSSVTFTATTGAGLSYLWRKNGVVISGATQSTYTANSSGNYLCVITNSCGSIASNILTVTVQTVPSITISATSTVVCTGGYVHISSNATAGSAYQWKLNGAVITGATSSSYNATVIGNYTCTASNACGNMVSNTITVTTGTPPPATITAAGDTTFCNGKSVVLNANTGTNYLYNWLKDGNYISAYTASYTTAQTGNYQVQISIAYSGCSTTSSGIQVTVTPSTTPANLTPPGPIVNCGGGNVVLNANTGTGLTYKWKNYGLVISGATSSAYTAAANGDFTVEITNSSGCLSVSTDVLVTLAPPVATIGSSGNTTFCSGNSVWLSTSWQPELTRQWKLNGSIIPGATNSTWSAAIGGSYTAMVTNACGSSTSSPLIVTVNPLPSATITPAGPTTFCSGGSVVLNAQAGANKIYQWKKGANLISGATLSSYTATTGGNYRVIVTNTVTGCSKTTNSATVVTVNALPAATITPQGPTTFCAGGSVVLQANTGAGLTCKWKKGSSFISGATLSNYTATIAGNYRVQVTNSSGCSKTSALVAVSVPCKEAETILSENVFDVKVFPNPSSGDFVFKISNAANEKISISVYDMLGKLILSESITNSQFTIRNPKLVPGVYSAEIIYGKNPDGFANSSGQAVQVKKILKLVKTR
ncbi:MAG TPA: LamG-like jellyroll fold domain-containing protein [Bacteroidia bacterium]|nr:LamG-like jellyroll fold domain-containing protein [Bacteroidia bacterium]